MTDRRTDRQTPHDGKDRAMQGVTRLQMKSFGAVYLASRIRIQ